MNATSTPIRHAFWRWSSRMGLLFCCLGAGCTKRGDRPGRQSNPDRRGFSVVLISLDTTRADHLGCYGHPTIQTTNIDRLAFTGTLFEQCATVAPLTLPSHSSMLTGTYPFVHGVRNNGSYYLAERNRTLAEALREHGYSTAAFVAAFVLNRRFGLHQGFDTYSDGPLRTHSDVPQQFTDRPANEVCDEAIAWLRTHGSEKFFLFLHFYDPHQPHDPPARFLQAYEDAYLGEIAHVDEQIGRLVTELQQQSIDRQTLIVLTADHGEGRDQHGEATHSHFVYDTTMHVPLILSCPGVIPAARRIRSQVRIVDIAPTIMSFLGLPGDWAVQGADLMPLLAEGAGDPELAAYGESFVPWETLGFSILRCLRIAGWKYILAPTPELYHVAVDVGEQYDVADVHPERAASMKQRLRSIIAREAPASLPSATRALSSTERSRLGALGYIAASEPTTDATNELDLFEPRGPDGKDRLDDLAHLMTAVRATRERDLVRAEAEYRHLADASPDNVHVVVALARILNLQGRTDDAIALTEATLQRVPHHAGARLLLADLLAKVGQLGQALEHYRAIIESDRENYIAHNNLGALLMQRGETKAAMEEFQAVLRIRTDDPLPHRNLAICWIDLGRYDAAVPAYHQAIAADPDDSTTYLRLAELLCGLGRFGEALALLHDGARRAESDRVIKREIAWIESTCPDPALRDGEKALAAMQALCRNAPDRRPRLLDRLAAAQAETGRFAEAVLTAREALALANDQDKSDLAEEITERIKIYESRHPARQPRRALPSVATDNNAGSAVDATPNTAQ